MRRGVDRCPDQEFSNGGARRGNGETNASATVQHGCLSARQYPQYDGAAIEFLPSLPFPSFRPRCIHSSQLRVVGRARLEPGDCGEAAAGNVGGAGSRRAAHRADGLTVWLISRLSPPPPPPQVNAMDGLKKSIVRCGRERGASVIISCGNGASQDSQSGGAVIGSHRNAKVPKFQEWSRS